MAHGVKASMMVMLSSKMHVILQEEEKSVLVSILPGICPQLRTRIFRFVLS